MMRPSPIISCDFPPLDADGKVVIENQEQWSSYLSSKALENPKLLVFGAKEIVFSDGDGNKATRKVWRDHDTQPADAH